MERLVLFAHGSADPRWRAPFERLAADVTAEIGAGRVRLAYMESAEPTLAQVAEEAARDGVSLAVLPLFMASGVHVTRDVEARARAAERAHPGLRVRVLPAAGEHPLLARALREIAIEAAASREGEPGPRAASARAARRPGRA